MKAGGSLPAQNGEVIVQGEDLGAWIAAQRAGWDKLMPAQQCLFETVGVDPDEGPAFRNLAGRVRHGLLRRTAR
ncbi:hypothetical protein [Streptomyces aureus]|uniref:hypothetical protein n=1 Tax=Streptomyces aureus TaxID=193461 RepID=UPI00340CD448